VKTITLPFLILISFSNMSCQKRQFNSSKQSSSEEEKKSAKNLKPERKVIFTVNAQSIDTSSKALSKEGDILTCLYSAEVADNGDVDISKSKKLTNLYFNKETWDKAVVNSEKRLKWKSEGAADQLKAMGGFPSWIGILGTLGAIVGGTSAGAATGGVGTAAGAVTGAQIGAGAGLALNGLIFFAFEQSPNDFVAEGVEYYSDIRRYNLLGKSNNYKKFARIYDPNSKIRLNWEDLDSTDKKLRLEPSKKELELIYSVVGQIPDASPAQYGEDTHSSKFPPCPEL
jgi:hypothetical protein